MARARTRHRSAAPALPREALTWAIGALVCAATLAAIGGYAYLRYQASATHVALDPKTLCPVDGARSVAVVLLDATDTLPDITKREVRTELIDLADTLPVYGLLELRLLNPAAPGGQIMFSKCNPGDGADLSEWTANPRRARDRWMEQFRKPLDGALDGTLKAPPADSSPIMATIQDIAVGRFAGRARRDIPKTLLIVSDMREHTAEYSQYKGDLSYGRFRSSAAYKKLHTDLQGADVDIRYVQRLNPPLHSGAHIAFWAAWALDNNAGAFEPQKLQGAN